MKHTKFILIIFIMMQVGCTSKHNEEHVFYNAKIYSVDQDFSVHSAMYVKDGKILGLGNEKDLLSKFPDVKKIDLNGAYVYPGFRDPHCHFLGYGLGLSQVNLRETSSYNEVVERIEQHIEKFNVSKGEWIYGRGWDQNDWPVKEFPEKSLLDEKFPNNPILLIRIDGHAAIANTKALELSFVDEHSSVDGGKLLKSDGRLNGILIDNAIELIRKNIPVADLSSKEKALLLAQQNCFEVGLVAVGDAGLDYDEIRLIEKMHEAQKLKMKIYAMLNPTVENIENFVKKGIYQSDRLTVSSIKLYADGALGSRGAKLLDDYSDDPGNTGIIVNTEDYFRKYAKLAYDYGYQLNIHCIGDKANRLILDVYADYLKEENDRRWRIEHAQIIHPDDLSKFGNFSIVPSIQTTHATSDMYWAEDRLGERIRTAYIYKDLLAQNGWLPNGSDFPIEEIDPLFGFYAAVARKDQKGWPENGFQMENSLSREEALRAMTIWAAKANFEEKQSGSLEENKWADFVVLDIDLMQAPENKLYKPTILATYIAGEEVYSKK